MAVLLLMSWQNSYSQPADTGSSDRPYTEKEISDMIAMVEQELDEAKSNKMGGVADQEIEKIEKGIVRSKKMLADKQFEEAYYTIKLTQSYFAKIDARLELFFAQKMLKSQQAKPKK
jgi:hypothetical protein